MKYLIEYLKLGTSLTLLGCSVWMIIKAMNLITLLSYKDAPGLTYSFFIGNQGSSTNLIGVGIIAFTGAFLLSKVRLGDNLKSF